MAATFAAVIALSLSARVEGFTRAYVTKPHGDDAPKGALADTFRVLDTDGSGFVEGEEIRAFAELQGIAGDQALADLGEIDTDGDGRLSFAELAGTLAPPAAASATDVAADDVLSGAAPGSAYKDAMATAVSSASESAGLSTDLAAAPAVMSDVAPGSYEDAMASAVSSASESTGLSTDIAASASSTDAASSPSSSASVDVSAASDAADASPGESSTNEWFKNATRTAQLLALHDAAELFVEGVAQALEKREKDTAEALTLEAKARDLRANATQIVKSGPALVEAAARQAVESALLKPMSEVQKLEALAELAERKAAMTREKARQLRERALTEQGEVLSSVRQLRGEVGVEVES